MLSKECLKSNKREEEVPLYLKVIKQLGKVEVFYSYKRTFQFN